MAAEPVKKPAVISVGNVSKRIMMKGMRVV
jgi:hypothetical protein